MLSLARNLSADAKHYPRLLSLIIDTRFIIEICLTKGAYETSFTTRNHSQKSLTDMLFREVACLH